MRLPIRLSSRLIPAGLSLLALSAAALAGQALWQEIAAAPSDASGKAATLQPPMPPGASAEAALRRWPALFGTPQPPAPKAPTPVAPVAEPQPPAAPMPPLESLGYALRGLVRSGDTVWALVAHPTGEKLVRGGGDLAPGIVATRIDAAGLWLSRQGNTPELLAFPD